MPYIPKWEPLAGALKRMMDSGVSEDQAKLDICLAVADRAVAVRVTVDDRYEDVLEKILEGDQVQVPRRLEPDQFEWADSRTRDRWDARPPTTGPHGRWRWIALVELLVEDVTRVLLAPVGERRPEIVQALPWSAETATISAPGGGPVWDEVMTAELVEPFPDVSGGMTAETEVSDSAPSKPSSNEEIRKAIAVIYDLAQEQGVKPPNIKEIGPAVLKKLSVSNLTASDLQIQKIAEEQKFKDRRGTRGKTVRGSFRPFSELEI
jgi:hypothetical protein